MENPKILVVGSINVDFVMSTDVFPKEGETVSGSGFAKAAGGKGANQAVQLARLGASVTMVGAVGDDSDGAEMLNLFTKSGMDISRITVKSGTPTGCAVIVLHGAKNRIIVYAGANGKMTVRDVEFLEKEISKYDMVVLQLEIPMEINEAVARYAQNCGVPVFLNTAPYAPLSDVLFERITYLCSNETETESLTGTLVPSDGENADLCVAKEAARKITLRGAKNALITLGGAGAYFCGADGEFYSPAMRDEKVVDTTAAGDSFIGGFVYSLSSGANFKDALDFANRTAAITVSRKGAISSLPTIEEVKSIE